MLPLYSHLQNVRHFSLLRKERKNRRLRLSAVSLLWFLWDVREPTLGNLSNSVFERRTSTGIGILHHWAVVWLKLLGKQKKQQYKCVSVKTYKKGEGLTSGWRASAEKRCFLSSLVTAVRMFRGCRPQWCGQLMVWVDNERDDINWDASPVSSPVTALIPVANFNELN